MIEFRIARHTAGTRNMVEVWNNGRFIASIYGIHDAAGRALVSFITKHGIDMQHEADDLLTTIYIAIEENG